jgi:pantoate--beta-alanine ligase
VTPVVTASVAATRAAVAAARGRGCSLGLVPTMGALHAGHASLIRAARRDNDFVAVSIFVNPTQFGPREDFAQYPRPLEKDLQLCAAEGVDLVFAPEAGAMYPPGYCTFVEVQGLQQVLCGAARPIHFRGVATVVLKLFQIVQPQRAYFGQKDAQQVRILQQMVRDLDVPLEIRVCPIVREVDGLALSSRNQYLNEEERRQAPILFQALEQAQRQIEAGTRAAAQVRHTLATRIATAPLARLEYAAVVDYGTLAPLEHLKGQVLLALAVHFGSTRLIDNALIDVANEC